MLALAAERGRRAVEIATDPDNLASRKVIEANGGRHVEAFDKGKVCGHTSGLRHVIDLGAQAL